MAKSAGPTTRALLPHEWGRFTSHSFVLTFLGPKGQRSARLLEIPAGRTVFARGDRPVDMFYVFSGEVRLVRRSRTGGEIVLQRTRLGFLAEASLFEWEYHCDAIAAETSRLLVIAKEAFTANLESDDFRHQWISHLARQLRWTRAHLERLRLKTAPERIVHYIETVGQAGRLDLNQSKKDWSADLGLTHEALYRALARMQKRGQLTVDGKRLTLRRKSDRR